MNRIIWIVATIIIFTVIVLVTPNLLYTFSMIMFFIYGLILAKILDMKTKDKKEVIPEKPKEDVKKDGEDKNASKEN